MEDLKKQSNMEVDLPVASGPTVTDSEKNSEGETTSDTPGEPAKVGSRRETINKNVYIMLDVNHKKVEPSDVIEYEWPAKSGDRWFLQEQIGELLDIKSFSRKFPDLVRRKVNHEEREFLEINFNIRNLLNETQVRDMNAMRSSEIHELMSSEYPDIFQEYKKVVSQREREIALAKAKEMEAIKNDSVKLAELRKKAVQSAFDFNKDLESNRKTDRKHFWDVQTNIIQSRLSRWRKMDSRYTKPHPYPVALIPGQFQSYFKKFTKQELLRLPVSTVLDPNYLYPVTRDVSPPPLRMAEEDLARVEREEAMKVREGRAAAMEKENESKPQIFLKKCESCDQSNGSMVCCTTCGVAFHPKCIEMPDQMADIVKTYDWNCMDCRLCSVCNKTDKEENVIFCDRCDRGFHTYCVGLKNAPKGSWYCNMFCEIEGEKKPRFGRSK